MSKLSSYGMSVMVEKNNDFLPHFVSYIQFFNCYIYPFPIDPMYFISKHIKYNI